MFGAARRTEAMDAVLARVDWIDAADLARRAKVDLTHAAKHLARLAKSDVAEMVPMYRLRDTYRPAKPRSRAR